MLFSVSSSSQRPPNTPKPACCASCVVAPTLRQPHFSPAHMHTTPLYRPYWEYRKGKLEVSEWWLEPPFLLRELLHAHVDDLVERDGGCVAATSSLGYPSAYEWSAHTDQGCRRDHRATQQVRRGCSVPSDLELVRAHGHGALNVDGDERGREGGHDAQPLRENTQRHASAR